MKSRVANRAWRTALAVVAGGCCLAASPGGIIRGAGATFPAPLYGAWSEAYRQDSGVTVAYDPIGSGAGMELIRRRQVDFGASDAPLTPEQLAAAGLLQFPVIVGGVVPVINIRGIKPGELRLSGDLLARIYLGRIRKWNEPPIQALNPHLSLPNANITVVHRSDSSGTTLLWTDYLTRSNALWRDKVGASSAPSWPAGSAGAGNEGVASYVQRTRFAIGYVEYSFAREHRLSDVALCNRSGGFVQAGPRGFRAAARAANWDSPDSMPQLPTDLPGVGSWPITGVTFILVGTTPADRIKTRAVLRFIEWGLHQGSPIVERLDYAALPTEALERLPALWAPLLDDPAAPPGP